MPDPPNFPVQNYQAQNFKNFAERFESYAINIDLWICDQNYRYANDIL